MAELISISLNGYQHFASRQGTALKRLLLGKNICLHFKTSHKQQQLKIVDLSNVSYQPSLFLAGFPQCRISH